MNFKITKIILQNRGWLVAAFALVTVLMAWEARNTRLSYDTARVLPDSDSTMQAYDQFKACFGADGNMLVIGFKSPKLFRAETLEAWGKLEQTIKKHPGADQTLSILSAPIPHFDPQSKTITASALSAVAAPDSIEQAVRQNPLFEGLLFQPKSNSTLMAVHISSEVLNSPDRKMLIEQIKTDASQFETETGIQTYLSGMPYIRHEYMKLVLHEMILFLLLALLVTILILYWFFRSLAVVLFSFIILIIEVLWSLGIMNLLGYKVSMLTGMLPSLIVVISIPNSIFIFNRFYAEYARSRKKGLSLCRTVEGLWVTLLLANVTTAIGFAVFRFTGSLMLIEFGTVAATSIMATFLLSLVLVPILLSYLPVPEGLRAVHLKAPRTNRVLDLITRLVLRHRPAVWMFVVLMLLLSAWGMSKVEMTGFVVDDLSKDHKIYQQMHFFDEEFGGVLPLEISIDTRQKNGVTASGARALYKTAALEKKLEAAAGFSPPLSLVQGLKFLYQHYRGGNPKYFAMPAPGQLKTMSSYLKNAPNTQSALSSFVDSTGQKMRVSFRMRDIGSSEMKRLMKRIEPEIGAIFPPSLYQVSVTGMSMVFLRNNDYLLRNLFESLLIEIVLIALVGMALFRSVPIILLSKIPCLLPLLITAGIMGFSGVVFKSSTILIFTIAFGLASDGTIYFLTRYRHELKKRPNDPEAAITITIRETGLSMIYTALILFFGFAMFAASSFGGTRALGILVSTTLFVSMISNLVLLPSILLTIQRKKIPRSQDFTNALPDSKRQ